MFKFGLQGNGNGQFDEPQGVTVDQKGTKIQTAKERNKAMKNLGVEVTGPSNVQV